ncbi:NnrS protein [Verrucomicrobiia bacterium DG1235]|nr:NnrS protein [Verrucomicrobiae bacterium DG1235]
MCQNATSSSHRFSDLVADEPFRVFFPLGMILGVIGVLIWPLYFAGVLESYPLAAHLRLMIHGFLGSFVIGFLFAAGPRLLGSPHPPLPVVTAFFASTLAAAFCAFLSPLFADVLFLLQITCLISLGAYGFSKRADLPPPGFLLGITGLLCALAGGAFMLQLSLGHGNTLTFHLSRILLFQAFPALPLIGIGAFFFPKLSGTPNPHDFPVNPKPTKPWLQRAAIALAAVAGFAISIVFELQGHHKTAYLLRAGVLAAYLALESPLLIRPRKPNTQLLHLIVCSLAMIASFTLIAYLPAQKTALLHGFFICGLTGSIILVATRVVLGHSGNLPLAIRSRKPLLWGITLLAFAASSRIAADFLPDLRISHYIYAALVWLAVAAFWMAKIAPKVRTAEPPQSQP